MHYDEAVFLQKLRRLPFVTKKALIDAFISAFPYGGELFGQSERQYKSHVENNVAHILDFIEPHGIKVVDVGLFSRPTPDVSQRRIGFQSVLYSRENA